MIQEKQKKIMKEIVIHRYIRRKKSPHSHLYYHYELVEDKCTKSLLVYRCIETGCLESFMKRDFMRERN